MVVCYIYQDHYPWDIRVDKICTSLASNSIETHIVSRNRNGSPRREQLGCKLYVNRLSNCSNNIIRTICNFPAFFSPFWIVTILSVIKEMHVDLIMVRDLPLAPTALLAGRITNLPVMMDMAENYPAMISDSWKYKGPNFIDFFIRNPWLLRKLEHFVLPRMDAVLTVSEKSAERIIDIGVKRSKVFIVGNTPRLEYALSLDTNIFNYYRMLSEYIILYVGGMEEGRGLQTVIKAIPSIIKSIPHALFCIVGKGSSENMLMDLANSLGVSQHVIFAGWQSQDDVPSIIAASDVCIVPHYVSEHIDTTVPNKIYDYMAQSKPVVVTNAKSLIHIVESNCCGKVYPDKEYEKLAEVVIELNNRSQREMYGNNGYKAVHEKYNWKIDEKILLDAVEKLSEHKRSVVK